MQRGSLSDLDTFLAVAENLSFRAAAAKLALTSPAVSHSIRQLEERIGVRLFNRTTRRVALTQAGSLLLDQLRPAFNQISGALDELSQQRQRPSGRLRIQASPAASVVVTSLWQRFLSTYPEVHLEVRTETEPGPVDLVASGFDAGIGPKDWLSATMVATRVSGLIKRVVVAAPGYFVGRRPPRTPDDLAAHNCIQYRYGGKDGVLRWRFERNGKTRQIAVAGSLSVNNPELAIRAAVDGVGLAYVSEGMAMPFLRTGQLVSVLEGWSPTLEGIYLFYQGRRQVPSPLRAFIDMVRSPTSSLGKSAVKSSP